MKNLRLYFACGLTLLPLASCSEKPAPELCFEQEEIDGPVAPPVPSVKEEVGRFRGSWAVVKGEIEGERASDYEDGPGFVFGEGDFRWGMGLTLFGRYTLHPSLEPKGITLEWDEGEGKATKVVSMRGIYRHEGDRIEVCLDSGVGERPTTFENAGKKGSRTVLLVLERHKPRGNPPMKKDRTGP